MNNKSSRLWEASYRQMLEEEQRCLARNRKLLEDFEHLEAKMRNFYEECKENEIRLQKKKANFLSYVISVYPQWKKDVEQWHERKAKSQNIYKESQFHGMHSTPKRMDTMGHQGISLDDYAQQKFGDFRKNLEINESKLDEHKSNMFFNDKDEGLRHARGLLGHSGPGGPQRDLGRYFNKPAVSFEETLSYDNKKRSKDEPHEDRIKFLREQAVYCEDNYGLSLPYMGRNGDMGNTNQRSFRNTVDMSWDELLCHSGYSRNDLEHTSMYHFRPLLSTQYPTPGMNPHNTRNHYSPGVQQEHSFLELGRPRFYEQENTLNEAQNERRILNERDQNLRRDLSFSKKDTKDRNYNEKESVADIDDKKASYGRQTNHTDEVIETRKVINISEDHGERRFQESIDYNDRNLKNQAIKASDELYNSAHQENVALVNDTAQKSCNGSINNKKEAVKFGGKAKDRQRHDLRIDGSMNEDPTDRTTVSENLDIKSNDHAILPHDPPIDVRITELKKRKWNDDLSGLNTESGSLPTIHQYEGDPRDLFSDLSGSEPLTRDIVDKYNEDGIASNREQVIVDGREEHDVGYTYGTDVDHILHESNKRRDGNKDVSSFKGTDTPLKDNENDVRHQSPSFLEREVGATNNKETGSRKTSENPHNEIEDVLGEVVGEFEINAAEMSDDEEIEKAATCDVMDNEKTAGTTNCRSLDESKIDDGVEEISGVKQDIISHERTEKSEDETETKKQFFTSSNFSNDAVNMVTEVLEHKNVDVFGKQEKPISEHLPSNVVLACSKSSTSEAVVNGKVASPERDGFINEDLIDDLENLSFSVQSASDRGHIDGDEKSGGIETLDHEKISVKHGRGDDKMKDPVAVGHAEKDVTVGHGLNDVVVGHGMNDVTVGHGDNDVIVGHGENDVIVGHGDKDVIVGHGENDVKVSHGGKSKKAVPANLSFSSTESSSESLSERNTKTRVKNKTKESLSYSEDFEASLPLTQSAAYKNMLSAVDISDEEEDLEEEFLQAAMSEANSTGKSGGSSCKTKDNSKRTEDVTSQLVASSSKPALNIFSSVVKEDNVVDGDITTRRGSSQDSFSSPPLSPDTGGYIPSLSAATKEENIKGELKENKQKVSKQESGKKFQISDTTSRIQAGFWNQSESESEVDLQISQGDNENNNDDDDDFDFYS